MKKILVVDDTKNIRTLLTTSLQIQGYTVSAVGSGLEALDKLANENYDLVFLDVRMPEVSGTEVLRRMRKMGIHIPVIIMTAYATIKNAVECTKLGAVYYLQKPFSAERILAILEEIRVDQEVDGTMTAHLEKAHLSLIHGDTVEAYDILRKALALNPQDSRIYRLIGQKFAIEKNIKESERFYAIATQFEDTEEEPLWGGGNL